MADRDRARQTETVGQNRYSRQRAAVSVLSPDESTLEADNLSSVGALTGRRASHRQLVASAQERLREEVVLGQVAAERAQSASLVQRALPHQRRHAGGAVDAQERGAHVDPGMRRAEIHLWTGERSGRGQPVKGHPGEGSGGMC